MAKMDLIFILTGLGFEKIFSKSLMEVRVRVWSGRSLVTAKVAFSEKQKNISRVNKKKKNFRYFQLSILWSENQSDPSQNFKVLRYSQS